MWGLIGDIAGFNMGYCSPIVVVNAEPPCFHSLQIISNKLVCGVVWGLVGVIAGFNRGYSGV